MAVTEKSNPSLARIAKQCMCMSKIYDNHYSEIVSCACMQEFIYPEKVAYPVGGTGQQQFSMIEMHYDNPDMTEGNFIIGHMSITAVIFSHCILFSNMFLLQMIIIM